MKDRPDDRIDFFGVFTLVAWVTVLAVGVVGLVVPGEASPAATQPATPPTQLLDVALEEPAAVPATPTPAVAITARATPTIAPPLMRALEPVPSAGAAFPVVAPVIQRPVAAATSVAPAVQRLTFGRGEGRQPPPVYPPEAVTDQQQGVVIVRFQVDPGGTVQTAEASTPCPWPLLNDAAVAAVRDRWRFAPGPARSYEVAIRFQLRSL